MTKVSRKSLAIQKRSENKHILSVHVTDLCNSKCTFCVVGSPLYATDSIIYDDIVDFLTANAGGRFTAVNLHGGEPTIHPKYLEILQTIKDLGYKEIYLQTNGIRLADSGFAAANIRLGVNLFIISLHGHTPEMQDSLTHSRGGYAKTIRGIHNVTALVARVRTNTVVTKSNMGHLRKIVEVAADAGVQHINISNLQPVGSSMFALDRTLPRLTDVYRHLERAVRFAEERGLVVTLEGYPTCVIPGMTDLRLNESAREVKMLIRGHVLDDYDLFMDDKTRIFGPPCDGCCARSACGGVYPQYVQIYDWDEFSRPSGP